MNTVDLKIEKLNKSHCKILKDFFSYVKNNGQEDFFHPHPFHDAEAELLANYSGKDLYSLVILNSEVIGYGILRGWDEGYSIPSLGILIKDEYRAMGLGVLLMDYLKAYAVLQNSEQIRLKVYPDNHPAKRLYQKCGYKFQKMDGTQELWILEIQRSKKVELQS